MYKCRNVTPLGPKSRRAQYGEGQRGGKDRKNKRNGKNGRREKSRGDYCGNKVNPMVRESSSSETSVHHHKIYWY